MKIGFVGLGLMGKPMCMNIAKKHDDEVFVWNRTKEKAVDFAKENKVTVCESAKEVVEKADVFISMVTRSEDSRAVYESILPALGEGKTCIDMSTIDPSVSREIAETVKKTGAEFIDAPVVKSVPAAETATLGIYVGGSESAYEAMRPILLYMGNNVIRLGENGAGLVMKICHNALVSQIQNGVNETSTLARANGIDILTFAEAISYGGAQNSYLDAKKQAIADENFAPAFAISNMAKDVNICVNLADECKVNMPGERNVKRVYDAALEKGFGNEDFCATVKVVREG